MNQYTAVDVETTGLDPAEDRIIEIGAVRYVDGKPADKFEKFIQPGFPLPEQIAAITNITDEMLSGAGEEGVVLGEFLKFLGEDVILGHNVLFDYSFLKAAAARQKAVFERKGMDTLAISRQIHPGMPSRSLKNMCLLYGLHQDISHRGYYDAYMAAELYEAMKEKYFLEHAELFWAKPLFYKVKKQEGITEKQKRYLASLLKGRNLFFGGDISLLSKSEASRMIDRILSGGML